MKKPNIVYILADDLGYGDLSCYGAEKINTPNIDALAKQGVQFTDAHAPSAVCTPTRYGILTGRYSWRSKLKEGVLHGHSEPLIEQDRLTVPSYLKRHGYATACIGKWHLGLGWGKAGDTIDYSQPIKHGPTDLGFDYFYGISASLDMPPYCFIENNQTVGVPSVEKEPKNFGQQGRPGLMVPGWKDEDVNQRLTQKAVSHIESHMNEQSDRPLFMYVALTGPHTPWEAAERFKGRSKIGERGDMILELDWTVGELIKTLKALEVWDNTLFVVTSDNGPHPKTEEVTTHNHSPAGIYSGQKADIWEGGHRIPFIASWPNVISSGTVTDELTCLTDLLASCADICEDPLSSTEGEDSISFLPVLKGGASIRESVIHHSISGMFSVRNNDWKLILGQGSGGFGPHFGGTQMIGLPTQGQYGGDGIPGQLYDLKVDPYESDNVYLEHPTVVQELTEKVINIINHD